MIAAAALALVGVGACGGSSTSTPPDAARLRTMLLTVPDVGVDWVAGPPVNDADFYDASQPPCDTATLDEATRARLQPVVGVQFEASDAGYRHLIEFGTIGASASALQADLRAQADAVVSCAGAASGATGGAGLSVRPLALGALGDQRHGFELIGREVADASIVWIVRTATVRKGAVAIHVGLTEIVDSPSAPRKVSDDAFVALVRKAAAKLDR